MNKSLQVFKLVSEYAPIHIIFTDPEGTILYANKAVEKITGYSPKEVIGSNPRLWGKQMTKSFYRKLWQTIKHKKKLFTAEITNKRKNGELYIADTRIAPVLDEKNVNLLGFVGIEWDITKEKEVDQAKTEFVSLASHQLKNPLTVIRLYTNLILEQKLGKLVGRQKKALNQIKSANERMINLVNSLLNISRIELGRLTGKPELIKIASLTQNIFKELKPQIEKKAIIFKEKHPKHLTIRQDPNLLTIILQNLVSNAVKYTPKAGKVIFKTSLSNGNLKFEVTDTGYGIPKKEQGKMFTKLFRASNIQEKEPEGNGLGLYLVKLVVDKLKGKIWFKSRENKGTTFYVTLPPPH